MAVAAAAMSAMMASKCNDDGSYSCSTSGGVTIRRLLYAKEMTFKGKDGSTSIL